MEKYINLGEKGFFDLLSDESKKGIDIITRDIKFDNEYGLVYHTFIYRASGKIFGKTIKSISRCWKKGHYLVPDAYGVPYENISVCDLICEAA